MEQVWRRVALREELTSEPKIPAAPHFAKLEHDMERHIVNRRCILDRSPAVPPGAGWLKRVKTPLKRRAGTFLVTVLDRYFDDEQQFLAHLVRLQNNIAESHDHLAQDVTDLHRHVRDEALSLRRHIALLEESIDEKIAALQFAQAEERSISS